MRRPERIKKVLRLLEQYWKGYPDLRLGQILVNASYIIKSEEQVFYLEDDKLIKWLEKETNERKCNETRA